MFRLLTFSLLASVFFCPSRASGDDNKTVDAKQRFAHLGFLKGNWRSNMKLADSSVGVSELSFDTILDGQFMQLKYGITKGSKVETHLVVVGPGAKGALTGWTFTSEGKSYESNIDVQKTEKGVS